MHKRIFAITLGLALLAPAQVKTEVPPVEPAAKPVTVEHIKIHGAALEGNLEGDAVDRDALVFLPPSYAKEKSRRYPVVYALHGYSIGAEQWSKEIHVPQTIEGAFAKGATGNDRRAARFEDRIQRLDVFQFRYHWGLREITSRTMSSPTSTRITGRFPSERAAVWSGTRWAATARAGSA